MNTCSQDRICGDFKGSRGERESIWLYATLHRPDLGYEEDKIIRKNPTLKTCEYIKNVIFREKLGTQFTIWSRDDGIPFPALGEQLEPEPDPENLCPECGVTKQLWKNHYQTIERWREESKYYP